MTRFDLSHTQNHYLGHPYGALQVRKMKIRELKCCLQVKKWQSWNSNAGALPKTSTATMGAGRLVGSGSDTNFL